MISNRKPVTLERTRNNIHREKLSVFLSDPEEKLMLSQNDKRRTGITLLSPTLAFMVSRHVPTSVNEASKV